ncbi:MAG TPA: GNAT family N-acetyltransferase [Candidatus Limiplasma sp.]|nr:GNAT family N-acetyltransferase [Candidatus Limiplasma sp.]HPS80669.1 GNAT family N-acetyltransferase [Candidatus Limiplasma sp.]
MVEIYPYRPEFEEPVMQLISNEGDEWSIYWQEPNNWHYQRLLTDSITYVALAEGQVCAFLRALDDVLNLYVCDLLVVEPQRGKGLGKALIDRVKEDYPEAGIYILSGNDEYYDHIGCTRDGAVYRYCAADAQPAAETPKA